MSASFSKHDGARVASSEPVLNVTMTPAAAKVACKALALAAGRITADLPEHPRGPEDIRAWEAEQWLNWLGGRIREAESRLGSLMTGRSESAVVRMAEVLRDELGPWIAAHPNAGLFDWRVLAQMALRIASGEEERR